MFRFFDWLVAHLIGAGFVWWLLSPRTTASTVAICIGAACAGVWGWLVVRRALRSSREKDTRAKTLSPARPGEAPPTDPPENDRR